MELNSEKPNSRRPKDAASSITTQENTVLASEDSKNTSTKRGSLILCNHSHEIAK